MMAAIAVTRFGLGARPGELDAVRSDPKGFLKSQIRKEGADQPPGPLPTSAERLADFREYQRVLQAQRREPQPAAGGAVQDPKMAAAAIVGEVRKDAIGVA